MFFKSKPDQTELYGLYNAIVAQSRQPFFYAEWGVPDTVTGRFDAISVHMALFLERLTRGEDADKVFAQALFDLFFKDMDRNLREMGVGDVSVPKRITKMGEVFYGLSSKLNEAVKSESESDLAQVLRRNVAPDAQDQQIAALANYCRDLYTRLMCADIEAVRTGVPLAESTK